MDKTVQIIKINFGDISILAGVTSSLPVEVDKILFYLNLSGESVDAHSGIRDLNSTGDPVKGCVNFK